MVKKKKLKVINNKIHLVKRSRRAGLNKKRQKLNQNLNLVMDPVSLKKHLERHKVGVKSIRQLMIYLTVHYPNRLLSQTSMDLISLDLLETKDLVALVIQSHSPKL